jgi:hypothetical protein
MKYNVFCIAVNILSKFELSLLWQEITIFELAYLYCAGKIDSLTQLSWENQNAILMLSREIHAFNSKEEFLELRPELVKQAAEKEKRQKEQAENSQDNHSFCQCFFLAQEDLITSEEELANLGKKINPFLAPS